MDMRRWRGVLMAVAQASGEPAFTLAATMRWHELLLWFAETGAER